MDKTYNQYKFLGRYGERFFDDLFGSADIWQHRKKRNRSSEQYNVTYDQLIHTAPVKQSLQMVIWKEIPDKQFQYSIHT